MWTNDMVIARVQHRLLQSGGGAGRVCQKTWNLVLVLSNSRAVITTPLLCLTPTRGKVVVMGRSMTNFLFCHESFIESIFFFAPGARHACVLLAAGQLLGRRSGQESRTGVPGPIQGTLVFPTENEQNRLPGRSTYGSGLQVPQHVELEHAEREDATQVKREPFGRKRSPLLQGTLKRSRSRVSQMRSIEIPGS